MSTPEKAVPEPVPEDSEQSAPASPPEWPLCSYCGSSALRGSTRGGLRETMLRLAGATLLRCETCGRRFAFMALGHPLRHGDPKGPRRRHSVHTSAERVRSEARRRKLFHALWICGAAVLSFLLATYMIAFMERRSERERIVIPIQRR